MKNVTFIEDLIDLDTLHGGPSKETDFISQGNMEREALMNQVKTKNIRMFSNHHAGMGPGSIALPPPSFYEQPVMYEQPMTYQQPQPIQSRYMEREITCIEIANHIKDCPICSKFYNNDQSVYIASIALLVIVCILLFKRILECK